jgi:hypothetical protein
LLGDPAPVMANGMAFAPQSHGYRRGLQWRQRLLNPIEAPRDSEGVAGIVIAFRHTLESDSRDEGQ